MITDLAIYLFVFFSVVILYSNFSFISIVFNLILYKYTYCNLFNLICLFIVLSSGCKLQKFITNKDFEL